MKRRSLSKLIAVAWLTVVWVVLFESYDLAAFLGGIVTASLIVLGLPSEGHRGFDAIRPYQVLRFVVYFIGQVFKANAIVAWEVITPGDRVNEGIVEVPVTGASDAVVATLANVISLTPGTLIVEVVREPQPILYVHVLHLRDIDAVRLDIFQLERYVVRAIGSESCLRDVETRIAALCRSHPELGEVEGIALGTVDDGDPVRGSTPAGRDAAPAADPDDTDRGGRT